MRDIVEKLRKTLPPFLTVHQYCAVKNCCEATAYNDLRADPDPGVKFGYSTRIVRDVMLGKMARSPAWVPQKDRVPKAKAVAHKKTTRAKNQTAAPQREPDREVRP